MKVYITKYALTAGIEEAEAEIEGKMAIVKKKYSAYFHGSEWHLTRSSAIEQAEIMRERKIASLRKSIEKIEAMRFE